MNCKVDCVEFAVCVNSVNVCFEFVGIELLAYTPAHRQKPGYILLLLCASRQLKRNKLLLNTSTFVAAVKDVFFRESKMRFEYCSE